MSKPNKYTPHASLRERTRHLFRVAKGTEQCAAHDDASYTSRGLLPPGHVGAQGIVITDADIDRLVDDMTQTTPRQR